MTNLNISLKIRSTTPLSLGAGGSAGTLAHKTIVRDGQGRPIIPASHLKGKTRWAAEQLLRGLGYAIPLPFDPPELVETPNPIRNLFGSPQHRSPLYFADLIGTLDEPPTAHTTNPQLLHHHHIRPAVAINRRRGTADDTRLLFQETALEHTIFFAEEAITGHLAYCWQAALLWAALRLISRWGGATSRGLGWAESEINISFQGVTLTPDDLTTALRTLPPQGDNS